MTKQLALLLGVILFSVFSSSAQEKPTIVVQPFTTASGIAWPYDMKLLQTQAVAELQNMEARKYLVTTEVPSSSSRCLILSVEILEWHPGNAAKRALVGMGSGRESAKIRFALTDQNGKKIFEHEDTVRTEFYASAYASSVGQLAHPLADKIGHRIAEAKFE